MAHTETLALIIEHKISILFRYSSIQAIPKSHMQLGRIETFDPENKDSIMAALEKVVANVVSDIKNIK